MDGAILPADDLPMILVRDGVGCVGVVCAAAAACWRGRNPFF